MTKVEYKDRQPDSDPGADSAEQNEQQLDWLAERRNRLNVATQETRFKILQKIIGHPQQLPTLKELDHFLPGVSKSTIRNHLETLQDADLVARVELPEDERKRDNPHVFYGLTADGRRALEDANLLITEDLAQKETLLVELPPDVQQYSDAPRPEWGSANEYEPSGE